MGLIILIIVGGVVGWLASLIMRTDAQQGILVSLVGAVVLLGIINLFRRGTVR